LFTLYINCMTDKTVAKASPIAVRLPTDLIAWLDSQAEALYLTRTDIVVQCILDTKARRGVKPQVSAFHVAEDLSDDLALHDAGIA
jgi:hypothetical protein